MLDLIVHRPDLPIYPGGPRVGLGLWNFPPATVVVESVIYVASIWIYLRTTRANDGIGRYGFWSFVAFLALVYVANIVGPPPPSVKGLAVITLFIWLFVLWTWWFDRHREVRLTQWS